MKRILLFLFLCLTIFKIQAQTPIVLTFNSNDATNWADGIAQDGEGGSTNIPGLSLQIFNITDISGAKLNFPMEWKNDIQLSGTDGFTGLTTFNAADWYGTAIKSADGAEFKINGFSWYDWGWQSGDIVNIRGYRDNVQVATSSFIGNFNGNRVVVDLSSNSSFNNVDEVRIFTSGSPISPAINGISITAHVYASSVSSTKSNGSYKVGEIIPVNVSFSEPVNVTNTPQLKLETGTTDRIINYASGTGTSTLTFNYTVEDGDNSSRLSYFDSQALTLNGGQIKAVSNGFNAALTLPVPGGSGSLSANKDIIIDGIVPTLTSVNSSTANGTYKEGDVIAINLNFSEVITVTGTPQLIMNSGATVNYSSGSGTSTLSFNYTVQAGNTSADLDYISTTALSLNGGSLSDEVGNNATLTLPAPGAANSLGANKNIVIDTTSPVVSSVSSSLANGTHKINDIIPVSVNFSEAVIVTGTPTLSLNSGGTASYASGSGTTTLVFNYTVALNQSIADLDQASTTALSLAAGTIKDAAGNDATLTLAAPGAAGSLGANKDIAINTTAPTTLSITRTGNAAINGTSAQFLVTFSENVTGVNTSDFSITSTGITAPAVTFVSGSNNTRTVTVNTGTGSGTLRLDLKSSGTGIINTVGNEIQAGYTAGEVYTIDKVIPTLINVTIASNNANTAKAKTGDVVTLSFTASETIGTPVVSIFGNTATVTNITANDWTATYTTQITNANGIIPFNIAFADVAGNVGIAVTATTNASSVTFDKTVPALTTVAIVSNNASNQTAKTGNIITLTFAASEAVALPVVTIAGNPVVPTSAGGNSFTAAYTLTGTETEGAVAFNIAFTDLTGNAGTDITATTNSSSVTYDKMVPTLSGVTIASNNLMTNVAKAGNIITLNFMASEVIATPTVTMGGIAVTPSNSGGNSWTATQTVSGLTPEGILAFNIAFSDLPGNPGTPVTATTNSSSVLVDRTAPAAPTGLTATAGNTQNTITWNASPAPDLDKYILYGGTSINPAIAIQTIPAGTLTYTHTGLTNGVGYFYRISAVDATGNEGAKSGNIVSTPKGTQTITFNPLVASVYGATPVTLTASSSSALAVTYTSSNTAVATVSGSTVTILAAGTTTITASQIGDAAFLAAAPVTQDLVVNKKDIAVNAVAKTKIYGTADPVFTYTFSPALIGSDTFTGALERIAGDNVGVYGINQGTVALNANYTITFTSADLQVTAKSITITAAAETKIFGDTDPTFIYTVAPALIGMDNFTGSLDRALGENAGNYAIGQGSLSLGANYQITYVPANLSITAKAVTVVATAKTKVYGNIDPALTYTFTPELIGTDVFTGTLDRTSGENIGSYAISQGTLSAGANYTLLFSTANLNITKKTIAIAATAGSKAYGAADPAFAYTFSPALIGTDVFTGTLDRASGENIGNYAIGQGTLALNGNYNTTYTPADFSITKKTVTVTAIVKTKAYGVADPSLTYTFSPALIGTDVFTGNLDRTTGENIGNYAIGQGSLALNNNYLITYVPANLSITTKVLTVTAVAKNKTYGDGDPALTYSFSPVLIGTDVFTGNLDRTIGENIGGYAINQGTVTAGPNYQITYVSANLNIGAKSIGVTATAANKIYGAADPTLAYTFSPALIGTDTFSGSLNRAAGENVGTYAINKNTLALSSNYVLNYTTASLTIGKAPLSIIGEDKEKFTGTTNPTFTAKYTGLVNGETSAVLTTPAIFSTTATTSSPIGTYTIVPSGAVAANYQISYVNGTLTVKPGAPTNVLLAGVTLYENKATGTAAGTLSSTSDDPNATFAYSLVSGTGDTDNALFSISGNQLLTAASLDYENKTTYSVRVRSTTQYGFSLDKTFTIALSDVNELPTLAAIANQTICYTATAQNINLTGISAGPESTQSTSLSVVGNNSALLQSLSVSGSGATAIINYSVKTGASGTATITVTVKDNGGTANGGVDTYSRAFVLTVNALPVVSITADKGTSTGSNSIEVSKGETVFLNATGGAIYAWANHSSIIRGLTTSTLEVRPRETTTYTVTVTNASGCSETQTFSIKVLDDLVKIKATNIMSPNGDGINDKWIIDNIDFYPNNEVKIFDRSGRLIYSKKGYDNSWEATLNGAPLAEGTYYYLIDFGTNRAAFKGYITVIRTEQTR
ncbi:gliding motility-associated C-terminal domain-containing protein [Pedobacter sp. ok626]|uniref:MBG domain-containing protein n=1 Tax=Pedobacter sp. ok626 TaxID=1761882 RepID=UPI00087E34A7|nr:MBG domain-containing protein [Pedobacter sp. ok626]SDL38070.1 gliding motility-associated C-terminal domain-containing protein [Pedobacter sp. ok626]